MAHTPAEIADWLKLSGLSGPDELIEQAMDEARRQPGKRNRTPESRLAEFLHDTLCDVKTAAEQFIAVLATQEAEAERIAEEADSQYGEAWGGFAAVVTAPKGAA